MDPIEQITIRPGGPADAAGVLAMLDGATRWLAMLGRTGQWGTQSQSANPRRVDKVAAWAGDGSLHVAVLDRTAVGALAAGAAPEYVPAAGEPELYVNLLVTDRSYAGHGIGARLLAHAGDLARARRLGLLRVDCYAGGDGALVRYYQGQGFTPTDPFTVRLPRGPWPGQVLVRRLPGGQSWLANQDPTTSR